MMVDIKQKDVRPDEKINWDGNLQRIFFAKLEIMLG
jgi:hypothetical protein